MWSGFQLRTSGRANRKRVTKPKQEQRFYSTVWGVLLLPTTDFSAAVQRLRSGTSSALMLLAASPHVEDNPLTHDAPETVPSEVLVEPPALSGPSTTSGAGPHTETINRTKPPAHAIHTPQQLAQLEAIAQAQTRGTPESTTISDEEKYLAAQVRSAEWCEILAEK
ncbi:hypothetical protein FRC10_002765 [Ceratobasidium sp. 414]|nr:hypothetical protein FRC10_002765 [Ceratobasidium sp. 414]